MRRLIVNLSVAVLTFAVGALASALFYVTSPANETGKGRLAEVNINELTGSDAPAYKIEPIPTDCRCHQGFGSGEADSLPSMADLSRAPISGGVLNGKALSLPQPEYPTIAKAAHASGSVVVQVVIDKRGCVESAHAVGGHPLLQSAAVQAASQARFTPTRLSGQPVKVTGVLTYNFVLQ